MESGDGWCATAGTRRHEATQIVAPATEEKDGTDRRRAQEEARSNRKRHQETLRDEETIRVEETSGHEAPRIASVEVVIAKSLAITIRR